MGIFFSAPTPPNLISFNNPNFVYSFLLTNYAKNELTNDQVYCLVLEVLTLQNEDQIDRIDDILSNFNITSNQQDMLKTLKNNLPTTYGLINFETVSLTPYLDFIIDYGHVDITDNFEKMINMDINLAELKASVSKICYTRRDYAGILKFKTGYTIQNL